MFKVAAWLVLGFFATCAIAQDGKNTYEKVCSKCHRTGVDGAPKISDKDEWAKRLAKGKPALIKSITEGKGEMPERAGKELTDEQIKAALDYVETLVK